MQTQFIRRARETALGLGLFCAALFAAQPAAAEPAPAKSDVPVRVSASTQGAAQPNGPVSVTLSFRTKQGDQPLAVRYRPEGSLLLQSAERRELRTDAAGLASDTVALTAGAEGLQFLNVFVSLNGRTRAVSVPVRVGSAAAAEAEAARKATAQQAVRGGVIEMKASETVK